MKRVLILCNTASMILQFNLRNIDILMDLGFEVDVACNFVDGNTCSLELVEELKKSFVNRGIGICQIDFKRGYHSFLKWRKISKQINLILSKKDYSFVHCHSPAAGIFGRLSAHKFNVPCIVTAHGLMYHRGAPIKNWLLFYPIEKYLSEYTTLLITINHEDYNFCTRKFKKTEVLYLPGIGIDLERYDSNLLIEKRLETRKSLGVLEDDIMLLSVGELSKRKNHFSVIKAIKALKNHKIKYYICGIGKLKNKIIRFVKNNNMENQIFLEGYRSDVANYYNACDIFVFPSLSEGLPVALMEAIAMKKNVVCSSIRGNVDLVSNSKHLFSPLNCKDIRSKIVYAIENLDESINENYTNLLKYDKKKVDQIMHDVYKKYL